VVVGASAGGVEALTRLVQKLPADLAAPILVVLHVAPTGTSVLPSILTRAGSLPARHAEDGMRLQPGCIYVAPPDRHLLVEDGVSRLDGGPKENGHRPAIDTLFRSAAHQLGTRTIGLILSGVLDDGSAGLRSVRSHGGVAMVQDPDDAFHGGMPQRAIEYAHPDYVLPIDEIASLLPGLVRTEKPARAAHLQPIPAVSTPRGNPHGASGLTCPECNGALWEVSDSELVRHECRVGHAYTSDSLVVEQAAALEAALWGAIRALEERAALARRLAEGAELRGTKKSIHFFLDRATEAERHAATVRDVLESMEAAAGPPEGEGAA
jgi:two-component system, chemotaxis family, protein-glutamate methylesterase/glutaminase